MIKSILKFLMGIVQNVLRKSESSTETKEEVVEIAKTEVVEKPRIENEMFSDRAFRLILEFEGLDQPSSWPGGSSGVSIGIGYDLGYQTTYEFETAWSGYLTEGQMTRLKTAIGLKGERAKEKAKEFTDIKIRYQDAVEVFRERTIPKYEAMTRRAFRGFDYLPNDAKGALVSLVYNRGAAMNDSSSEDRRREMRVIRDTIPEYINDKKGVLEEIAKQIRSMKRLWEGTKFTGLIRRREAEARLVESCI